MPEPALRLTCLALLSLLGCNSVASLTLPETPGVRSTLLIFRSEGGWTGESIDRDAAALPHSIRDGARAYAFDYDVPLAALGLKPGVLLLAETGRPFPTPTALLARDLPEGRWGPVDPLELVNVRMRDRVPGECEAEGGCFVKVGHDVFCEPVCVEPPPVVGPTAPELPALPRFDPCPLGWAPVETATLAQIAVSCLPPSLECPGLERRWLGDLGCAPQACADWPTLAGAAIYVDPLAAAGGDGSQARPLTTIAAALGQGSLIALHAGVYAEAPALGPGVTIVGACASGARIEPPLPLQISGAVHLEGIGIEGRLHLASDAELELERVDLADPGPVIVLEAGARLIGARIGIDGGTDQIRALGAGVIDLVQANLQGATIAAIDAGVATVSLAQVSVRPEPTARGILSRGRLDLDESVLAGATQAVDLRSATASISRSFFDGARRALNIRDSDVGIDRVEIRGGLTGIVTSTTVDPDRRITITRLIIHELGGIGASFLGGSISADQVWVARASEIGINAVRCDAAFADVFVESTQLDPLGSTLGITTAFGARDGTFELRRWWATDHAGFGIIVSHTDGERDFDFTGTDLTVIAVDEVDVGDLSRGQGILLGKLGTGRLERVRVVDSGISGIRVEDGSAVTVMDAAVIRAQIGIEDRQGLRLDLNRVYVEQAQVAGVFAQGYRDAPTTGSMRNIEIVDAPGLPPSSDGIFLKINDAPQATMTIENFHVGGMNNNGILVERDWTLEARQGLIEDSAIGLHVDSILTDDAMVESGVIYRHNLQSYRRGQ